MAVCQECKKKEDEVGDLVMGKYCCDCISIVEKRENKRLCENCEGAWATWIPRSYDTGYMSIARCKPCAEDGSRMQFYINEDKIPGY